MSNLLGVPPTFGRREHQPLGPVASSRDGALFFSEPRNRTNGGPRRPRSWQLGLTLSACVVPQSLPLYRSRGYISVTWPARSAAARSRVRSETRRWSVCFQGPRRPRRTSEAHGTWALQPRYEDRRATGAAPQPCSSAPRALSGRCKHSPHPSFNCPLMTFQFVRKGKGQFYPCSISYAQFLNRTHGSAAEPNWESGCQTLISRHAQERIVAEAPLCALPL
jgi:hypothetical protein